MRVKRSLGLGRRPEGGARNRHAPSTARAHCFQRPHSPGTLQPASREGWASAASCPWCARAPLTAGPLHAVAALRASWTGSAVFGGKTTFRLLFR